MAAVLWLRGYVAVLMRWKKGRADSAELVGQAHRTNPTAAGAETR